METTSSALMETVFPEFLDGRFNPNVLNPQIRKIVYKLFTSSEAFKNSSKKFKKGFKSAMKRERETDRTGYREAKISSELNELLYEDSKDNCWCYQKKVDII